MLLNQSELLFLRANNIIKTSNFILLVLPVPCGPVGISVCYLLMFFICYFFDCLRLELRCSFEFLHLLASAFTLMLSNLRASGGLMTILAGKYKKIKLYCQNGRLENSTSASNASLKYLSNHSAGWSVIWCLPDFSMWMATMSPKSEVPSMKRMFSKSGREALTRLMPSVKLYSITSWFTLWPPNIWRWSTRVEESIIWDRPKYIKQIL